MGSLASKAWNEVNEYYSLYGNNGNKTNDSIVSSDTPNAVRVAIGVDPRSPALQFERTPIQLIDSKDTEVAEEAEKLIQNLSKMSLLSDPRSPTIGIDRTPIDLVTHKSVVVNPSPMQLSFDSIASNSGENSLDCIIPEEVCLSSTPISDGKVVIKENQSGHQSGHQSGQRVRTPLGCVQQKQTPNRNVIKQRKQLEITRMAHLNSHLMKTKAIADIANDNSLNGHQVIDDKENH